MFIGPLRAIGAKLKSIKDLITAGIDTTVSSRASSSALATLQATVNTVLGRTDVATSTRGGGIKQIVQGSIAMSGGAWTTFNLSSYSMTYSKCLVLYLGAQSLSTYGAGGCTLYLNAAANRIECLDGAGFNGGVCRFMVVEFY